MNHTTQDHNAPQEELLAELREHIVAGEIEVVSNEVYFNELRARFPVNFPYEGAEVLDVARAEEYEADARGFFEGIVRLVGLKETDRLVVLGDAGLDVAILMPLRLLRDHFASVIDIPQHLYLVPEDVAWCVSFRMERDLVFGRARSRAERDAEPETKSRTAFQVTTHLSSPAPPPRLYAILAREAPVAVIFRRGPSEWVQLIRWDTSTDTFTPGQWFHGRIYERRCDLSPDGTKLIYFAQKINRRTLGDEAHTYAWTAVSRPPYFTALALWPKGDCWHGGGLFETNRRVWLNHRPEAAEPHPDHKPPRHIEIVPNPHAYGEDGPVEWKRLERDGWVHKKEAVWRDVSGGKGLVTDQPDVFEKRSLDGRYILRWSSSMVVFFKPVQKYSLVDTAENRVTPIAGAEWADWDQNGRLVFAQQGKLFAAEIDAKGQLRERELTDLNGNRPEPVPPPDWALQWKEGTDRDDDVLE